jgi:hypothetical protein
MKVTLRDGQLAELRERITHGQDKEISKARRKVRDDVEDTGSDIDALLRAFVSSWNVKDVDGKPINLEDGDAFDRAPSDIIDTLVGEVIPLYAPATVPNPPTPSSSDGSSTPTVE